MFNDSLDMMVRAAVDSMRTDSFFMETYLASDHGLVESIIAGKPAVLDLAGKCPDACAVIARLIDSAENLNDRALIPCMVVLRLADYRGGVPAVLRYLEHAYQSADNRDHLSAMNSPYPYAVHTLDALTQRTIPREILDDPVANHEPLIRAARSWLDRSPR